MFRQISPARAEMRLRRAEGWIRQCQERYGVPAAAIKAILYLEMTRMDLWDVAADLAVRWRLLGKKDSSTGDAQIFGAVGLAALNFGVDRGLVRYGDFGLPEDHRLDPADPRDVRRVWLLLYRDPKANLEIGTLNLLAAAQEQLGRTDFEHFGARELQRVFTRYNQNTDRITAYGREAYRHYLRYRGQEGEPAEDLAGEPRHDTTQGGNKMLQQVMTEPGKILFQEVPTPEPGPGQVLVKIMRIGVCGSDIHVYHGTHPFTSYPVTQGHEVSGIVERLGEGVAGLEIGRPVTLEPQVVCGRCWPCRHGKYNLCEKLKVMGFQTTGTASEYFAIDAEKVTPLPQELTLEEGAMIEPLAVAVHAVRRAGDVAGKAVCVLGAGPIGILTAQVAKGLGAARVMITDISDIRLAKAREVGVDVAVNTRDNDFAQAFEECFGPDKADVIYECAGTDLTMDQAIQNARKGSTIILVAVFDKKATVDLAVLNDHELDLNTSMMYRHEDYLTALELVQAGRVQLKPLISKVFPFREYLEAYRYIDENRESTMKVIIDVQG